jgi:uncharacterized protein
VLAIRSCEGGVELDVRVSPRASRDAILGVHAGALKIALTAPPVEGAANEALVTFLAERLGLAKRAIVIRRGDHSKTKTVFVRGATVERVRALREG